MSEQLSRDRCRTYRCCDSASPGGFTRMRFREPNMSSVAAEVQKEQNTNDEKQKKGQCYGLLNDTASLNRMTKPISFIVTRIELKQFDEKINSVPHQIFETIFPRSPQVFSECGFLLCRISRCRDPFTPEKVTTRVSSRWPG